MSLAPNAFDQDKYCFVYCGDDKCTCLRSSHEILIRLQSDEELERKAEKARRKDLFTQKDLDDAKRKAARLINSVNWE